MAPHSALGSGDAASARRRPPPATPAVADRRRPVRDALAWIALAAGVGLAYQPVWQAGFVWDDDEHITRPSLRSLAGLGRIWWDVTATQQYYPVTESLFWLQHRLWGDWSPGYHLVNIALHVLVAILVIVLLRRLDVPGAALAGALFALHPVHVETVAWVTEQKNTLSAVFYLAAALAYLQFDATRHWRPYLAAFGLFVVAVLAKIVTVTLPPALLVVFWWRRGELSWRRDGRPLLPFFGFALGMGILLVWLERTHVGAEGPDFAFTLGERCLLPGRIIVFYLATLLWPADLQAMYPRWNLQAADWRPWACWAVVLAALAAAWGLRRRVRGPLAALLFFGGTLFPVLGLLDVYWFVFSFVGNHLQYLASLGILAPVAAGAALLTRHRPRLRLAVAVLAALVLLTLGTLTWRHARMFRDATTFYETILARNPGCWMASVNLGQILADRGELARAVELYRTALRLRPSNPTALSNLGWALWQRGEAAEAERTLRQALLIAPDHVLANLNLGWALAGRGRAAEAIGHYERAIAADPDCAMAHNNLGLAWAESGDLERAMASFRAALAAEPSLNEARVSLAWAHWLLGDHEQAERALRHALRIDPGHAMAHNNLGLLLADRGPAAEAIRHFELAIAADPRCAPAHTNLGLALAGRGDRQAAIACFRRALEIDPGSELARTHLAEALAAEAAAAEHAADPRR